MGALGMAGLGLLLILLGGDALSRGAAGLLQKLGIGAERTGAMLVVFVFWLPQLAIGFHAAVLGGAPLGVQGAIGAGVGNLGLLLGLSALVAPLPAGLSVLAPLRIFALVGAGLVLLLARDGVLVAWEGGVAMAAFVAAAVFALSRLPREDATLRGDLANLARTGQGVVQNLLRLGFAGVAIYFGSRWLALNANAAGAALGFEREYAAMFVLGVGAYGLALLRAVDRGLPLPFGRVHNRRSLIFVRNLVDAVLRCATDPRARAATYFVKDGEDLSTAALVRGIATALGVRPRLVPVPVALMRAGATLLGRRLAFQKVCGSLVVDAGRIRRELGWEPPVPVDAALAATARWYRDHGRTASHA